MILQRCALYFDFKDSRILILARHMSKIKAPASVEKLKVKLDGQSFLTIFILKS